MLFLIDDASPLTETLVDSAHGVGGTRDFCQEDGLQQSWLCCEFASIVHSSGSGNDLSASSVNSVGVQFDVMHVHFDSAHAFFAKDTFSGDPLEGTLAGISDFLHVLDSLRCINQEIGARCVWSEAPDFIGFGLIPVVILNQLSAALLWIVVRTNIPLFNFISQFVIQGLGSAIQSVVLVWRFSQAHLIGFFGDGLLVSDDRIGGNDRHSGSKVISKILQTNFYVQLSAARNDLLSGFVGSADNQRIGLGQLFESFDQLGEILRILWLHCDSHHRRDTVFHVPDHMCIRMVGDCACLKEVLIDADQSDSVSGGNVSDLLHSSAHHQNSSLDVLFIEVILFADFIVWAKDSHLLASVYCAGKHAAKGEKAGFVHGWHHL